MFFAPIYSYDEPLHYLLILISFYFLFSKKLFLFTIFFAISCLVRESTLILLFGLFYYYYFEKIKYITFLLIPIIIYLVYRYFLISTDNHFTLDKEIMMRTNALKDNFKDLPYTSLTLFSLFSTVIFPIYFFKQKKINREFQNLIHCFYIILTLNTLLVLTGMLAAESRLLFLPFLFIVPFFYNIYDELITTFQLIKQNIKSYKFIIYFCICIIVSVYLSYYLYYCYNNLINEYWFVLLLLFLLNIALKTFFRSKIN